MKRGMTAEWLLLQIRSVKNFWLTDNSPRNFTTELNSRLPGSNTELRPVSFFLVWSDSRSYTRECILMYHKYHLQTNRNKNCFSQQLNSKLNAWKNFYTIYYTNNREYTLQPADCWFTKPIQILLQPADNIHIISRFSLNFLAISCWHYFQRWNHSRKWCSLSTHKWEKAFRKVLSLIFWASVPSANTNTHAHTF